MFSFRKYTVITSYAFIVVTKDSQLKQHFLAYTRKLGYIYVVFVNWPIITLGWSLVRCQVITRTINHNFCHFSPHVKLSLNLETMHKLFPSGKCIWIWRLHSSNHLFSTSIYETPAIFKKNIYKATSVLKNQTTLYLVIPKLYLCILVWS